MRREREERGRGGERRRGEREGGEEEALCCSFIKWNLKLSKYYNIQVFCLSKQNKEMFTNKYHMYMHMCNADGRHGNRCRRYYLYSLARSLTIGKSSSRVGHLGRRRRRKRRKRSSAGTQHETT